MLNYSMLTVPTFDYEHQYRKQGFDLIAGVDEVGMGALAGPVCAGAVVFDSNRVPDVVGGIRDSKALSPKRRERAALWIKQHALAWAVGEASVEEITALNILQASHLAMRRAIETLKVRPDLLLVDGRPIDFKLAMPAVNIISGDALSISIAAASVLAKVYRDDIMRKLDRKFPGYKLASNKGYGSAAHKAALARLGATPHHRPLFAPIACLLTAA